ncbi:MAG: hotdog fold thioesterase [Saprospiraceae bacterium]|nr:hotdog fold thioesterase [Saprospiraceae bacterium]
MIWKSRPDLVMLNAFNQNSLGGHLGIEFTEVGDDFIRATMPVDHRTVQPMGLLHGGASVVLSETLGSVASLFAAGPIGQYASVGIEVNANHLKSAKSGKVTGTVRPVKSNGSIHVWNTDITDEAGNLICSSRLTVMVRAVG